MTLDFTRHSKFRKKSIIVVLEVKILVLDEQITKYKALDEWFRTPQGIRVAQAFLSELAAVKDFFGGKSLIQLGSCGNNPWLSVLQYRQKWVFSPCQAMDKITLLTSLTSLPIERNSIDCVVAPMTLEAFGFNRNPLDEIDRILKPMGYAVFIGVNPVSFWGAALRFNSIHCFGKSTSNLSSSLSLKHAMISRGYTQCLLRSFYYIPPVSNRKLIHQLEFFNEVGKMIWPFPAGFYCFIVQKYQSVNPSLLFDKFDDELLYFARN